MTKQHNTAPQAAAQRNRHASSTTDWSVKSQAIQGSIVALHGIAEPGWSGGSYTTLAREGFMRNPVVHRCVRYIAETAASIPWTVCEGATEHPDHPARILLTRPNAAQSGTALLEALIGHLLLSGSAFAEISQISATSKSIHLLRPDRVTLDHGHDGWVTGYRYQVDRHIRKVVLPTAPDAAQPLLRITQFHPLDDHKGYAPLGAAMMALDIHNAASRWNKALLDNAARPSGALVYAPGDGTNMTEDQFARVKQELEEGYTGSLNAGRPMLLEGGLDWKAMGLTPKDMDFIEAKNAASRDIALAFGVPPMLLGIPGDNTYANYQEANRAFYRLTILPLLRRVTDAFSHWLAPHFGQPLRFECKLDEVPGLAAERDALWQRVGQAGFLTDDEKRAAVGYAPMSPSSDARLSE